MLRIALVNDAFLPIQDGVGRVVYEYANGLGSRGHECYVIAPMSDSGYRGKYPFEIVDFQSVSLPGNAHLRTGVASLDMHYLHRISSVQLDLVHAHSPGPAGMEAVRLASKLKIPLIGTFHSKFYDDFLRATRSENLAAMGVRYVVDFFDRCDEVWTVSSFAAETLREYGYDGRIEIVQNGVSARFAQAPDVAHTQLARTVFGLQASPILLYVGQIDWKKNIRCIIEAALLLHQDKRNFQLVFVGQGQDMEEAQALAYRLLPKQQVCFTGHIRDDALLASIYGAATLFLFPSEYDTAGLVVREAAMMRTPSIVLRGSAPSEIIRHKENGLICENNPRSLCDAVAQALEDPDLLRRMGEGAQRSIPIAWDTVLHEVEERYYTIVKRDGAVLKRKRGFFRRERTAIDQTLEKRTIDMMWRFLKQDMQHIYAYESIQHKAAPLLAPQVLLPRATPESQGIPSGALLELYHDADKDENAGLHAMLVLRNGNVVAEGYWQPYMKELPHQLYSLSKSITATAIGLLWDEGKLQLNERLVDIFSDKVQDPDTHPMADCTVWHLLTMSTGARFNEIGSTLGADWAQEFLDGGVLFPAGTQFHYNSLNTYMLSAIVCRKTGGSMMEYLRPRLFAPLHIENATWELCPLGIEKGGWGLSLTLEDVAKIGWLYLQKGSYVVDGKRLQLISEKWVEEATRVQIDTPNGECRDGYGYQIWMAPDKGAYLFNGAFGQYMLALPGYNALVALFSGSTCLFAQGGMMGYVLQCFASAAPGALEENPSAQRVLHNALSMLSVYPRRRSLAADMMQMPFRKLCSQLDGKAYALEPSIIGLFPFVLQGMRNNFSGGIHKLSFAAEEQGLAITIYEGEDKNRLLLKPGGYWHGTATVREETYAIGVGGNVGMLPNGDTALHLFIHFLETPNTRICKLYLHEDGMVLHADESPSVEDATAMLMELARISKTDILRKIVPLLKQQRTQHRARTFTTVATKGILIPEKAVKKK